MKSKIEQVLEGDEYGKIPQNMLDAEKFFGKFDSIEHMLNDTLDRSRMEFTREDVMKFIELMCDKFQIKFVSIDNRSRLIFRDEETTHKLYVSIICYRDESIKALKEIIDDIENVKNMYFDM